MAKDGIVGEYKSSAAREVLYTWEEWEALKHGGEPAEFRSFKRQVEPLDEGRCVLSLLPREKPAGTAG